VVKREILSPRRESNPRTPSNIHYTVHFRIVHCGWPSGHDRCPVLWLAYSETRWS